MDLSAATVRLLRALPRSTLTRAIGWLSEREVPPPLRGPVLGTLAAAMHIDMVEAERPIEQYVSFQNLFCRGLAAGLRTSSDDPDAIVSPIDGALVADGTIQDSLVLTVKSVRYSVAQLLGGDAAWASRFVGGSYQVFYLSPRDYHRMHSPVTGRVLEYRWIRGDFWPVNSLADRLPNVYCDNERVVSYLDTGRGVVAMVKVAAFGVGYISLSYLGETPGDRNAALRRKQRCIYGEDESPRVTRGEEIASFGLGSTVVLLYERSIATLRGDVQGVRVGMEVARAQAGSVKR
jgi:phosphatidylserine decarboxylase